VVEDAVGIDGRLEQDVGGSRDRDAEAEADSGAAGDARLAPRPCELAAKREGGARQRRPGKAPERQRRGRQRDRIRAEADPAEDERLDPGDRGDRCGRREQAVEAARRYGRDDPRGGQPERRQAAREEERSEQ